MSLQTRVLGSIAVLLVVALLCGGAVLSLDARSIAAIEVSAAFTAAESSVRDTLKSDVEHTVTLRQVVASFEGQRHVRAALVNEKGQVIVKSDIGQLPSPAPHWFARLILPPSMSARIPIDLPQYRCVVQLTSDPSSELADVWAHARDAFLTMLLFCAATMLLVSLAVAYVSRFLHRFHLGILEVSEEGYDTRLGQRGPPEFVALTKGFNHMAARLASFSENNRRLQLQIQSVQEEERAGIARDLHDEVGPYLFAIQVDAKALAESDEKVVQDLGSTIRDAAFHIQRHVREILRQLKPLSSLEFGLETAIADLIAFWSRRRPTTRFEYKITVSLPLDRSVEEVTYRIVQESVSNAVRHGEPKLIDITIAEEGDELLVSVEDDGGGLEDDAHVKWGLGHFGLAGMKERVKELRGHFWIEDLEHGVRVQARLPRALRYETA